MPVLQHSRRHFVKQAVLGASLAGPAVDSLPGPIAAQEPEQPRRKSRIRLGVRFSEPWLKSENDTDLRFFKQIGVDYVDIELVLIKGYAEQGIFARSDLRAFFDRLDAVGLRIERANALGPYLLSAHLNRPEGQKEIDNLKRIGEMLAEAEIPVFGIQACQASQQGGYSEVFVDDGDINMPGVLRTLEEGAYTGVIDYDHAMQVTGDEPLPKQYIAYAMGYMRGLLHSL